MGGFDEWDRTGQAPESWDDDPWGAFEAKQRKATQAELDAEQRARNASGADPVASVQAAFARFGQQMAAGTGRRAVPVQTGPIWSFSVIELQHLAMATGAFTIALGFMFTGGLGAISALGPVTWMIQFSIMSLLGLMAVGPAFLFHEFGHKFVAKHYGCWAEFRADPRGLGFGMLIAAIIGVVFMAPGAVMVSGMVTRKENANIAVAGPLVNLALMFVGIVIAVPVYMFAGVDGFIGRIMWYWIVANIGLGLLNMLPFGPLDGLKVKSGNPTMFWGVLGLFVLLAVTSLMGVGPVQWPQWLARV